MVSRIILFTLAAILLDVSATVEIKRNLIHYNFTSTRTGRTKRRPPLNVEKYACLLARSFGEGGSFTNNDDEFDTDIVQEISSQDMTVIKCAQHCVPRRYIVLSDGNRCGCCFTGNAITFLRPVDPDLCSVQCFGDNEAICGGQGIYSVYKTNNLERGFKRCARHNHCQHGGFCNSEGRRRGRRRARNCKCEPGFRGDHCQIRIKVCDESGRNPCGPSSICNDLTDGGFSCACTQGHKEEKGICVKTDDIENAYFEEQAVDSLSEQQQELENSIKDAETRQRLALQKEKEIGQRIASQLARERLGVYGPAADTKVTGTAKTPVVGGTPMAKVEKVENVALENVLANQASQMAEGNEPAYGSSTTCEQGYCQNGGTCTKIGAINICNCPPGYKGNRCQIQNDQCKDIYCRNDGTCTSDGMGFECVCHGGFVGLMCETDVDECLSVPCMNDGLCVNRINAFYCQCPAGFTGEVCQLDIDECASNPCGPHGKCNNARDEYQCQCQPGYKGVNCDNDINECESAPCNNHGQCLDEPNGYTCRCDPGFEGTQCHLNVDECGSTPCQNNGECFDGNNEYVCHCDKGYGGVYCEIDIDECGSAPCQNNAACINKIGCFVCECMTGFSGALCEHEINECSSSPCLYGGECVDRIGYFTCECQPGFKGWTCGLDINECESAPCGMHAVCVNLAGKFMCMCFPGFSGTFCEREVNECASAPCKSGEMCEDAINGYHCSKLVCADGKC